MSELKASPRNSALGYIADLLTRGRNAANEYEVKSWVPLLGGAGIGDLLLGKTPEEVNEWSYGNAPMRIIGGGTGSYVPQTKQGRHQQIADTLFAAQMAPTGGLTRAVKSIPAALRHGAGEFAHASAAANPAIIKSKGGNWLTGSVENALSGLKKGRGPTVSDLEAELAELRVGTPSALRVEQELAPARRNQALNNWIEGPLTKYVKRDMATEGDPVRKLAEQGILHVSPEGLYYGARTVHPSGETLQKLGKSPSARAWENASDYAVASSPAETYQNFGSSNLGLDWVNKLDPKTPFYRTYGQLPGDLGFSHLTDELSNALNPESGLPRNLRLNPEDFQQMGMERAVRHVHNINEWRAAQKAEADAMRANNAATRLHKEYAENNPMGLRWVELKGRDPDEFEQSMLHLKGRDWDNAMEKFRNERYKELQDALKYEGDTMGHCVGGYCDDVLEGRSRIFSLRDAKGEPHVTIETRPPRSMSEDLRSSYSPHKWWTTLDDESRAKYKDIMSDEIEKMPEYQQWLSSQPGDIIQIKGKQNRAPNAEYLPFVQDFVKGGKWSDVGDLSNAGLYRHHVAKYPESVADLGEYATKEEIENWVANRAKPEFAQGGSVKSTTWRPMELDGIIGYITE